MNKPTKRFNVFNPKVVDQPHITKKKPNDIVVAKLFSLVSEGNINTIRNAISENNTTLDLKNESGESLVHVAIKSENPNLTDDDKYDLVMFLINNGAPVAVYDNNNLTPLHLAAKQNNSKLMQLLIDRGVPINHKNNQNMTALHYAVQADIFQCEKEPKIKSLYPKNKIPVTEEMKNLNVMISRIMGTDVFTRYVKNIINHIGSIDKIFLKEINSITDSINIEIGNVMANDKYSSDEKQRRVKKISDGLKSNIIGVIKSKLSLATTELDINRNQINGWGPTNNVDDKILEKNTFIDNINAQLNKHYNTLDKITDTGYVNDATNLLDIINNTYEHILYIYANNANLLVNKDYHNGGTFIQPPTEIGLLPRDLYKFIDHKNQDQQFYLLDIDLTDKNNANSAIYDLDSVINKYTNNSFQSVRATKNRIKRAVDRGVTVEELPFTNDLQYNATGVTKTIIIATANNSIPTAPPFVIPALAIDTLTGTHTNGDNYIGSKYTFISKVAYAIHRIYINTHSISNNLGIAYDHIKKQYIGKIYDVLIPQIIINIINVLQNMLIINGEFEYINSTIVNIHKEYKGRDTNHPYWYSVEDILDRLTDIQKNMGDIKKQLGILYDKLVKVYDILNTFISIANIGSALSCMSSIHTDKYVDFEKTDISELINIFTRHIDQLIKLPQTLEKYKTEVNFDNVRDDDQKTVDDMKTLIIEKFIPSINAFNFSYYICPYNTNQTDSIRDKFGSLILADRYMSIGKDMAARVNNILVGNCSTQSKVGFLINNINSYKPLLPYNGKGRDKSYKMTLNTDPSNILDPDATNLTGNFGNKLSYGETKIDKIVFYCLHDNIDIYLALIKYMLVQNIINVFNDTSKLMDPEIKNDVDNTVTQIKQSIKNTYESLPVDSILFSLVGKIADKLIINNIEKIITNESGKIANVILNNNVNAYHLDILHSDDPSEKTLITYTSSGLDFKFNTIFGEIISKYESNEYDNLHDFEQLKYSSNTLDDTFDRKNQKIIYNKDYDQENNITQNNCYYVNHEAIKTLINSGSNVNDRDISGMSPIFYSIQLLDIETIQLLLNNNAYVNSTLLRNENNYTPLQYAKYLYEEHNNNLQSQNSTYYKNLLDKLYKHMVMKIKNEIMARAEYKNNIMKYIDVCFGQLLIMLNNSFFIDMKSYVREWNFTSYTNLCALMQNKHILQFDCNNKKIQLLEITDEEAVSIFSQSTNTHTLKSHNKSSGDKLQIKKNMILEYESKINNLTSELNMEKAKSPKDKVFIEFLEKHIASIDNMKNTLATEIATLNISKNKVDNNINSNVTKLYERFKNNKLVFEEDYNKRYSAINNNVPKYYKSIFNNVINNVGTSGHANKYTGDEDYYAYNELWRLYLDNESKLETIDNIHIASTKLEDSLLKDIGTVNTKEIANNFKLVKSLYSNIFCPFVNDYFDLSDENLDENYALNKIVHMIIHTTRHIISANFYLSIVKTLTKLVMNNITKQGKLFVNNGNSIESEYIVKTIKEIISNKLAEYIIGKMPKIIVKYVLSVRDNIYDDIDNYASFDDIFNPIIDILVNNNTIEISNDSEIISALRGSLFPYYKDMYEMIITRQKIMIDNYCRLILNQSKYVEMMSIILDNS